MINPDKLTEEQKIKEGINSLKDFFDSFGGENDIYKQIFLEELVRFMLNEPIENNEN